MSPVEPEGPVPFVSVCLGDFERLVEMLLREGGTWYSRDKLSFNLGYSSTDSFRVSTKITDLVERKVMIGEYLSRILTVIKNIVDSTLSFFEGLFHAILPLASNQSKGGEKMPCRWKRRKKP